MQDQASALATSRDLATSRGPSLLTIARRSLEGECRLEPGTRVLVAVSGGPDSMALLSVLVRLGPKLGLTIAAHGVDHGLRPEAAAELDLAERFATANGIAFRRTRVNVTRGGNLQARAREARWKALTEAAHAASTPRSTPRSPGHTTAIATVIATAHHAEDRAETVLMRLLRGAGARGLAVLPPRVRTIPSNAPTRAGQGRAPGAGPIEVIRPLLRATKADVRAHLARHRIPSADDPSNVDPRYLRTRVRSSVMPLLRELDPAIVSHLCAIADDLEGLAISRQNTAQASWTAGLPRATQTAIQALLRSRSKEARVWLPDGLVVMAEPDRRRKESPD